MKQSVEIWNAHSVEGCFRKIFRLFSRRSNGERYITTRSVFEHHPGHISFFAKNPQPEILIVNLDFPNMKWHPKDLSIKLRKSHIQKNFCAQRILHRVYSRNMWLDFDSRDFFIEKQATRRPYKKSTIEWCDLRPGRSGAAQLLQAQCTTPDYHIRMLWNENKTSTRTRISHFDISEHKVFLEENTDADMI